MNKFIRIFEFAQQLFSDERNAHQVSEIIQRINGSPLTSTERYCSQNGRQ